MAKSWSGFKPQNEIVLLQWAAMTISDVQIALSLARISQAEANESPEDQEEFDFSAGEQAG